MSQTQSVVSDLRDMILSLDLGPGEKLTERWAEASFGASRTPVRAALLLLETEGLVVRDGRGWSVAPLDVAEIGQLFVYRELLEVGAVRLAMTAMEMNELDDLEALFGASHRAGVQEDRLRMGQEFHARLAGLSGNRFIVDNLSDMMIRLHQARWLDNGVDDDGWVEHRAILGAMRRRDEAAAIRLVSAHIARSRDRILAILQQQRRTLRARGVKVA